MQSSTPGPVKDNRSVELLSLSKHYHTSVSELDTKSLLTSTLHGRDSTLTPKMTLRMKKEKNSWLLGGCLREKLVYYFNEAYDSTCKYYRSKNVHLSAL
jgi:hypothetical protein